jgi:membrane protease subunit (stomatin/prohibitin family)
MGETIDSILNLPSKYDELSLGLSNRLKKDFSHFGLRLAHIYINSITPPPEVQQAIDDRSRMEVFKDMDKLMQMKAAMAMEKASEADGSMGSGMGMGTTMGLMMPAMFAKYFNGANGQAGPNENSQSNGSTASRCPDCQNGIPLNAKFCPYCGHQQIVFKQCADCGKNLPPNAKFCSRCGHPAEEKPKPKFCPKCKSENLPDSLFCNQCGEKY